MKQTYDARKYAEFIKDILTLHWFMTWKLVQYDNMSVYE